MGDIIYGQPSKEVYIAVLQLRIGILYHGPYQKEMDFVAAAAGANN